MQDKKSLFTASLLGGAIGDALGYTVEFMLLDEIIARFGRSLIWQIRLLILLDNSLYIHLLNPIHIKSTQK